MFDLISQSMLFLLETLKSVVGDYGWAIIVLTLLVRLALWPVSRSQMKSMKMMQELQPKMKMLQERYKADPQTLQAEMMKLYKDYKFNPLGGCLPMLVQLPLFIGLYWAISNPHFMTVQDPTFLNLVHLRNTGVVSHGGFSNDGKLSIAEGGGFMGIGKDKLDAGGEMTVYLNNGKTFEQKVANKSHALTVLPKDPRPGVPLTITTTFEKLGLDGYDNVTKSIQLNVINTGTKETESITFIPKGKGQPLETTLETVAGKNVPHYDVLILVLLFAATMLLSQKMMSNQTAQTGNEQQQQMMKFMPLMFSAFMFVFPIPAGVLLYMVTNSLFQIFQTWTFQRGSKDGVLDKAKPPSQRVLDIKPDTPNA